MSLHVIDCNERSLQCQRKTLRSIETDGKVGHHTRAPGDSNDVWLYATNMVDHDAAMSAIMSMIVPSRIPDWESLQSVL